MMRSCCMVATVVAKLRRNLQQCVITVLLILTAIQASA